MKFCRWLSWPLFSILWSYYCKAQCAFWNKFIWIYPSFSLPVWWFGDFVCFTVCISCISLYICLWRMKLWSTYGSIWVFQKHNFEHPLICRTHNHMYKLTVFGKVNFSYIKKSVFHIQHSASVSISWTFFWGGMSPKSTAGCDHLTDQMLEECRDIKNYTMK